MPHDKQRVLLGLAVAPHTLDKLDHLMMSRAAILLWHERLCLVDAVLTCDRDNGFYTNGTRRLYRSGL
jgi:hypothetical protein